MFDRIDPGTAARIFFGCTPEDIHSVCILTWLYAPYREQFEEVAEFAGWRKGFSGVYRDQPVSVILPGMGACAAGDAVVFLRYVGCRTIIYSGAAGGFGNCCLGDIFVPTRAVIGEGFSQYYTTMKEVSPSRELLEAVRKTYPQRGIHFKPIFTIGSITAQKRDFLVQLENEGIGSIDMETSAIFTASSHCSMSSVALHYISDLPLKRSLLDPFTSDELRSIRDGYKTAIDMVLELACTLSEQQ